MSRPPPIQILHQRPLTQRLPGGNNALLAVEDVGLANQVGELEAYFELHIEQCLALDDQKVDIGVVTSIVGLLSLDVELAGQANHAGTTPMNLRHDALGGAARVVARRRELARGVSGLTATVGMISVEPGRKNVVPGVCRFSIDVRAATEEGFAKLDGTVRGIVQQVADEEGLRFKVVELSRLEPVAMDVGLCDLLEQTADSAGASHSRLPRGPGHDAMAVGRHVPARMIFVPSRGGIGHSPDEQTPPEHCNLVAQVVADALKLLPTAP